MIALYWKTKCKFESCQKKNQHLIQKQKPDQMVRMRLSLNQIQKLKCEALQLPFVNSVRRVVRRHTSTSVHPYQIVLQTHFFCSFTRQDNGTNAAIEKSKESYSNLSAGITGELDEGVDWEEMSEFPPLRENIRSFQAASSEMRAADEALSAALDEIDEGLKSEVQAIVQKGADFHNEREDKLVPLEDKIQFHLINNHRKGQDYTANVQRTKSRMQGMLATLLSRVSQGFPSF